MLVPSRIWNICICWLVTFALALVGLPLDSRGASAKGYRDHKTLTRHLKQLVKKHKKVLRMERACRTVGKNDVWRLELGAGTDAERKDRPALLLIAGVEGNDLAGTASAVAWIESLVDGYKSNKTVQAIIDSTTIYVWPRLNPDGAAHYFARPQIESTTTDQSFDDDHDGLIDEDGPEDLNGDDTITWMRIQDPQGAYILDPVDDRLLLKADPLKGEHGAWRLLAEGKDNDSDDAWNEDGVGGVNLNRNFPHNYEFFASTSGRHQVSEVETRALADFVVDHPNIAVVFTFGAADNVVKTPKGEAPKKPPTSLHEKDVSYYRELGKAWRESVGLKKELTSSSTARGTFSDWMYYHRGRFSLAAQAWDPARQLAFTSADDKGSADDGDAAKKESAKEEPSDPPAATKGAETKPDQDDGAESGKTDETKKKVKPDDRNKEARAFLKWIDTNAPARFVAWKEYEHPDFLGQRVEIGGFVPFAKTVPPESVLGNLTENHSRFLTELAGKLPRVGLRKVDVKSLGEAVFDITVHVENTGYLPTALAQGELTREVYPTRVILKTTDEFILSGSRISMVKAIQSGEAKEVRWIVRAKGQSELGLEIISTLGGRMEATIQLKEGVE